MTDLSALWREDATEAETLDAYHALIDSGQAWRLEGSVGRTAMGLIDEGLCILGPEAHRDYYGNRVPAAGEIEPGYPGSLEYAQARHPERWPLA